MLTFVKIIMDQSDVGFAAIVILLSDLHIPELSLYVNTLLQFVGSTICTLV